MSKSTFNFEGNDIEGWLKHFRLELLRSTFEEVGVECCEDLVDIYESDEMMAKVELICTPIEFLRFKRSRAQTRILVDNTEPKSALKKVSFAEDSVNPIFVSRSGYESVPTKDRTGITKSDQQEREKASLWTCSFCKNPNKFDEKNCTNCRQPNLEMKLVRSSTAFKSGPWECFGCRSLNIGAVDECEMCKLQKGIEAISDFSRVQPEGTWYHPGTYVKGFMGMNGSWMCCGAKERKSVECQFGTPRHHPGRWEEGNVDVLKAESKMVTTTTKMDPHDIRQRRKTRRSRHFENGWHEVLLWKCCLSRERDAVGCEDGPHPNPFGDYIRVDHLLGHK